MDEGQETYAARLEIDYPEQLNQLTSLFRLLLIIPIGIIAALISGTGSEQVISASGEAVTRSTGGVAGGLFIATMLMIIFRQRYPRWWFDFAQQLTRFSMRTGTYLFCLTDRYPSTTDEQSVHLDLDYPDATTLSPGLALFKWFLAIPHYIVLAFLMAVATVVAVLGWISVVFSGRYPRPFFDYLVGVARWALRVNAYAFLLITDEYPPFSLQ